MKEYIENKLREDHKIVEIGLKDSLKDLYLPPISRTTWAQLPEKVRDILEEQHGYNHYNPQTDNIESKRLYCKE